MYSRYALLGAAILVGCAAPAAVEVETPPDFSRAISQVEPASSDAAPNSLDGYVDYALRHRPRLTASLERWRAARAKADTVDELGPLEIGYGYYISPVETRVGPQRHRVRVAQGFKWLAKNEREREAKERAADVEGYAFEREMLAIRWEVTDVFWRLWAIQQHHEWHQQHQEIVRAVADSIRGRVEIGQATIADVGQAELLVTRTADAEANSDLLHHRAMLEFARAVGVSQVHRLDVEPRGPRVPALSDDELIAAALEHPDVTVWFARRDAIEAERAAVRSKRAPDFGLAVEWMETGAAMDPSAPGSGKDALVGSINLKLPIWSGELAAEEEVLDARRAAFDAEEQVARRDAETAVRQALIDIHDSARAIRLYETTLVPQAEAVLGSVRGSYEIGQSTVAALMLAQDEVLEVRLRLTTLLATHERAWAALERLTALPIPSQPFTVGGDR